jgi:hypothetical protein
MGLERNFTGGNLLSGPQCQYEYIVQFEVSMQFHKSSYYKRYKALSFAFTLDRSFLLQKR